MILSIFEKVTTGQTLDISELNSVIKTLQEIKKLGGVVVVSENNSLITTYLLDSYNRKLNSKNRVYL